MGLPERVVGGEAHCTGDQRGAEELSGASNRMVSFFGIWFALLLRNSIEEKEGKGDPAKTIFRNKEKPQDAPENSKNHFKIYYPNGLPYLFFFPEGLYNSSRRK